MDTKIPVTESSTVEIPIKEMPSSSSKVKELPNAERKKKNLPNVSNEKKELPPAVNPENVITIDGNNIEIKPTKLKYQRDHTAAFYHVLDIYPLTDVLAMDKGVLDPDRDGDKCVFDFLIAVFNDAELVSKYYDEMDSETVMRCLQIFKRLNGINEKEEQAKNRASKETKL